MVWVLYKYFSFKKKKQQLKIHLLPVLYLSSSWDPALLPQRWTPCFLASVCFVKDWPSSAALPRHVPRMPRCFFLTLLLSPVDIMLPVTSPVTSSSTSMVANVTLRCWVPPTLPQSSFPDVGLPTPLSRLKEHLLIFHHKLFPPPALLAANNPHSYHTQTHSLRVVFNTYISFTPNTRIWIVAKSYRFLTVISPKSPAIPSW